MVVRMAPDANIYHQSGVALARRTVAIRRPYTTEAKSGHGLYCRSRRIVRRFRRR